MNSKDLRKLGESNLYVSPIGLGCWQFSQGKGLSGKFWPKLEEESIKKIIDETIRVGINWFDTAEIYGLGESERTLSRSLDKLEIDRKNIVIATKWWPTFKTSKSISKTINNRLTNLNTKVIDLYQIHNPYSFSGINSQMKEMSKLVEDVKVKYIGVSNFSAKQMERAYKSLHQYDLKLVSNQVNYSLINRGIEKNGVLNLARDLGITIIAYTPLGRGLLTGKYHENSTYLSEKGLIRRLGSSLNRRSIERTRDLVTKLIELGKKYEATPSQIALNWVINFHGGCVVAIPGATKVEQARDNGNAMKFKMSGEDMDELNNLSFKFK